MNFNCAKATRQRDAIVEQDREWLSSKLGGTENTGRLFAECWSHYLGDGYRDPANKESQILRMGEITVMQ